MIPGIDLRKIMLASAFLGLVIGVVSMALFNFFHEDEKEIYCPVCGCYCSGKGGVGCIDKPSMVDKK